MPDEVIHTLPTVSIETSDTTLLHPLLTNRPHRAVGRVPHDVAVPRMRIEVEMEPLGLACFVKIPTAAGVVQQKGEDGYRETDLNGKHRQKA